MERLPSARRRVALARTQKADRAMFLRRDGEDEKPAQQPRSSHVASFSQHIPGGIGKRAIWATHNGAGGLFDLSTTEHGVPHRCSPHPQDGENSGLREGLGKEGVRTWPRGLFRRLWPLLPGLREGATTRKNQGVFEGETTSTILCHVASYHVMGVEAFS